MILIDADDTVCSTIPVWLRMINETYDTSYKPEDATDWYLNCFNLKPEVYKIINSYDFHFNLKLIDGAYPILEKLWKTHKCRIVTAAMHNGEIINGKIHWFKHNLPFIPIEHLIFARDKTAVGSCFDYIIDDAPHNHINHPATSIIYDQPWNRGWNEKEKAGTIRVNNWNDIDQLFFGR